MLITAIQTIVAMLKSNNSNNCYLNERGNVNNCYSNESGNVKIKYFVSLLNMNSVQKFNRSIAVFSY